MYIHHESVSLHIHSAKMIPVLPLQSASRDPGRSPMQWSGDMNAGFNIKTNSTWLPVHPDYTSVNVEVQNSFNTVRLWRNIWPELAQVDLIILFLGPKER